MFIMYVDWPKLKPTPKIVQAPSGENVTGGATEGKGKDSSDAGGHAAPETAPGRAVSQDRVGKGVGDNTSVCVSPHGRFLASRRAADSDGRMR